MQQEEGGKQLPREILQEIFCKLPAKKVGQLSSVCKFWYEIVTDPTFIAMHIKWCAKNQIGFEYLISYEGFEISRLRRKSFDFVENLRFPLEYGSLNRYELVGSCNGLLCMTHTEPYFGVHTYLWNPLIGVFKKLRGLSGKLKTLPNMHVRFGFGFESGTSDYKVFQIVRVFDIKGDHRWVTTNWVYSLTTDSWKQVREANGDGDDDDANIFPTTENICYDTTYCINGAFYWMQCTYHTCSSVVIKWFDFCDETIRKTKLPIDDYYDHDREADDAHEYDGKSTTMSIGSLNNSLALFVSHLERQPPPTVNVVNVWLLKQDTESSSSSSSCVWVKQFQWSCRNMHSIP